MAWIVELLDDRVRDELEALPPDMQARFRRIVELIQGYGLERVHEPHVKHLEGPLWEMRMKGKDGISRAVYVTAKRQRVVVVRVFVKKTQKTPRREIEIALQRAKEAGSMKRTTVDDLHKKWMKNPKYRREYEALDEEFSLAAALIEARARAGLTQEQVAQRMKTTQAVVARLEGGGSMPSTRTLEKYAKATGTRLKISFEPEGARP
jgi:phage-related protein/DNA-binding XRE family transcriptional regulator